MIAFEKIKSLQHHLLPSNEQTTDMRQTLRYDTCRRKAQASTSAAEQMPLARPRPCHKHPTWPRINRLALPASPPSLHNSDTAFNADTLSDSSSPLSASQSVFLSLCRTAAVAALASCRMLSAVVSTRERSAPNVDRRRMGSDRVALWARRVCVWFVDLGHSAR